MAKKVLATLQAIRSNRALYDYEVEWLENIPTASTRISTGIKITQSMTIEWISTLTSSVAAYAALGPRSGTGSDAITILRFGGNANTVQPYFTFAGWVGQISKVIRGRISVIMNKTQTVINDTIVFASSSNRSIDANELYIWGDASSYDTAHTIRYESLKIKDEHNVLLRDYIPVVKDNVGYMYDKVSGQLFGNESAQGAFTWGPIVKRYTNLGMLMPYYDRYQAEEEMYKELFFQLASNTLPEKVDITLGNGVKRDYFITSTTVKDLTIRGFDYDKLLSTPFYKAYQIEVLRYPDFTYLSYSPSCVGDFRFPDLYIPNVRRFNKADFCFYGWNCDIQRIHIEDTCANIKAYQNFPGSTVAAQLPKMKFIGTDGYLTYNSGTGEWDFTANS